MYKGTHRMKWTREYETWCSMKRRCQSDTTKNWSDYGGRGITICDRWKMFENFFFDMGEKPEGMTLDRVDNNKGYSPENCRWASRTEQANNRRSNRWITYNGETLTLKQWAEKLGLNYRVIWARLVKSNWPIEKVFSKEKRCFWNIKPRVSKFKGVYKNGGSWMACAYVNGKKVYLGTFKLKEDAQESFNNFIIKICPQKY